MLMPMLDVDIVAIANMYVHILYYIIDDDVCMLNMEMCSTFRLILESLTSPCLLVAVDDAASFQKMCNQWPVTMISTRCL